MRCGELRPADSHEYGEEVSRRHDFGRALLVLGYSLVAIGAIIISVFNLTQRYVGAGDARAVLNYVADPLSMLAGLVAWWFLSALVVTEKRQVELVRRAFAGLSLQAFAVSITYFVVVTSGISVSWPDTAIWGYAIGQAAAGAGFFALYLDNRAAPRAHDDLESALSPQSELI